MFMPDLMSVSATEYSVFVLCYVDSQSFCIYDNQSLVSLSFLNVYVHGSIALASVTARVFSFSLPMPSLQCFYNSYTV